MAGEELLWGRNFFQSTHSPNPLVHYNPLQSTASGHVSEQLLLGSNFFQSTLVPPIHCILAWPGSNFYWGATFFQSTRSPNPLVHSNPLHLGRIRGATFSNPLSTQSTCPLQSTASWPRLGAPFYCSIVFEKLSFYDSLWVVSLTEEQATAEPFGSSGHLKNGTILEQEKHTWFIEIVVTLLFFHYESIVFGMVASSPRKDWQSMSGPR